MLDEETPVIFKLNGETQKKVLTIADVTDYLEEWAQAGDKVAIEILGDEE